MRYNLGLPPAPHWATISCVALSTSSSTVSRDQLYFVWDSSRVKSTGSDLLLTYKPYYNLICVLMRSNLGWSPAPHWATISCVALSSCSTAARDQLYLVGIVVKVNQPAQTIFLPTNDTTTSYVYWWGSMWNLGSSPAPHWVTISCVALFIPSTVYFHCRLVLCLG